MIAYTAIVGDYSARSDVACFGDEGVFKRHVMEAKRYKVLPHLFFQREDVTVWVDGNIRLKVDVGVVVDELLGEADVAVCAHPYRDTVWQEFAALEKDRRFAIPYLQSQLRQQRQAYRDDGLPADAPLYECNILVRRNNERVARLMDAWWAQICRWQWRDQVSFPYVLWKHGGYVDVRAVTPNAREHPFFDYVSRY